MGNILNDSVNHTIPFPFIQYAQSFPSMLIVLDMNGKIIDINDTGEEILEKNREDIIHTNILSYLDEGTHKKVLKDFFSKNITELKNSQLLSGQFECKLYGKKGHYRWVQVQYQCVPSENNQYVILASCHDLTKQKGSELLLKSQRTIQQMIVQDSPLKDILQNICHSVELHLSDSYCSIELLENGSTYYSYQKHIPTKQMQKISGYYFNSMEDSLLNLPMFIENIFEEIPEDALDFKDKSQIQSLWSFPIFSSENIVIGILSIFKNSSSLPTYEETKLIESFSSITCLAFEHVKTKQELDLSKQRYRTLFEDNIDVAYSLDPEGFFTSCNRAAEYLTGYSRDEILQMHFINLVNKKDYRKAKVAFKKALLGYPQEIQTMILSKERHQIYLDVTLFPIVQNNEVVEITGIAKDVTKKKLYEEMIHEMAYKDPLTDLPNRRHFETKTEELLDEAKRKGFSFAVLYIDMDRFKNINDTLGHRIGDLLLKEIARRLSITSRRETDFVCRMGGDEFTVLIPKIKNESDAILLSKKILKTFQTSINVEGYDIRITPSIGISIYPRDGLEAESIIKHADIAMYEAKKRGKNQVVLFDSEQKEDLTSQVVIEHYLDSALTNDEFYLKYQPIFNIETHTINGVEALLRWNHPELGTVPPNMFIPVAEESGVIIEIGEWVFHEVCKQIKVWEKEQSFLCRVAVNVSMRQLQEPAFSDSVKSILLEWNVKPENIEIEVTESTIMRNEKMVLKNLTRLKEFGIRISIDDFGTGYSSLNYIKQFPVDKIKIDRSFINDIPFNQYSTAILDSIMELAERLGITVVAEGVEREEQINYLKKIQCTEAQGYYFCIPLKSKSLLQFCDYLRTSTI